MLKEKLQATMDQAVEQGVFPGGVLLAVHGGGSPLAVAAGRLDYNDASPAVELDTVYDTASLTKILCTSILAMIFMDRQMLGLDDTLEKFWPDTVPDDKKNLTIEQLLSHATGFTAWKPFYEELENLSPKNRKDRVVELILNEPFEAEPGTRSIYSDLNFILLGIILEKLGGQDLDVLFEKEIKGPLNLKQTGYRSVGKTNAADASNIAPTENCPDRGLLQGRVDDHNAFSLSGKAGHAGLFGTAHECWKIIAALRTCYRGESGGSIVSQNIIKAFWDFNSPAPSVHYALGFDRPQKTGSSSGRFFSPASVGHLGFTGTSIWYDPEKDLAVILLTNRVHPTSENLAIRQFRPMIHDMVAAAVADGSGLT